MSCGGPSPVLVIKSTHIGPHKLILVPNPKYSLSFPIGPILVPTSPVFFTTDMLHIGPYSPLNIYRPHTAPYRPHVGPWRPHTSPSMPHKGPPSPILVSLAPFWSKFVPTGHILVIHRSHIGLYGPILFIYKSPISPYRLNIGSLQANISLYRLRIGSNRPSIGS